ncbi:MAG TPA: outer membrane protein assembly factor BamE [Stellaceae bacterium]|nr:outer membrane protein assembly factor BamE [Stellaceae bacterium]
MRRTHSLLAFGAAALFAFLAGCHPAVDQRGNLPTEAQLKEIKPGASDKATVTRLLGSPSSIAAFDGDTWYYISQKTKEVAFFRPELVDQEVLVITFDKEGVVREIRHRGLEDRVAVVPNPNATPAAGREFTFLEQLIGNFGRFSSSTPTGVTGGGR